MIYEPRENFSQGLISLDIPELGKKVSGKVRDIWDVSQNRKVILTTDRQSAYDRLICTVPGKGQVLNLMSAFWFDKTKNIVPNHLISVPHPNVSIVTNVKKVLPVEVVLRKYMARSATSTSVFYNYFDLGRREMYGIKFPDGIKENEVFPMGVIITATTKYKEHDEELTDNEAKTIVDKATSPGTWEKVKKISLELFECGEDVFSKSGLMLVDTKYEFGLDENSKVILIDEIHTPDSSRLWLKESYLKKISNNQDPDNFDKEIIRKWLAKKGFRGEGKVPIVTKEIIQDMSSSYLKPHQLLTGKGIEQTSSEKEIINSILKALNYQQ